MAAGQLGDERGQEAEGSAPDAGHAAGILRRLNQRVDGLRARVVRRPGGKRAWRIGVAVIGFSVVAAGLVLLVIPGPGWLVIFVGLGILAREFAWARALLDFARRQVRRWTAWIARQPRWLSGLVGATGLIAVGLIVWLFVF